MKHKFYILIGKIFFLYKIIYAKANNYITNIETIDEIVI